MSRYYLYKEIDTLPEQGVKALKSDFLRVGTHRPKSPLIKPKRLTVQKQFT